MSFQHDQQAHAATARLLRDLRAPGPRPPWATGELTTDTTYWNGILDWPRPDSAFQDKQSGASLAIEFKPGGHGKGEYVRGLGQVITYLRYFEYAALVVPRRSIDGFEIAHFLRDTLSEAHLAAIPLALFSYERHPAEDIEPLVHLRPRPSDQRPPIPKGVGNRDVFWAYWRDLSQHDLLTILSQMDSRDQDFSRAYEHFWKTRMLTGRALNWDGTRRDPQSPNSAQAHKINTDLSLRHIGLTDATGHLTEAAHHLLRLGKVYGADSAVFMQRLAALVLEEGRHLDLIFWIDEQQRQIPVAARNERDRYLSALDKRLFKAGIIPRVPDAGGKAHFLRDEMKLWNKLGLLEEENGRYFTPGTGLVFNWRAIVSVVGE